MLKLIRNLLIAVVVFGLFLGCTSTGTLKVSDSETINGKLIYIGQSSDSVEKALGPPDKAYGSRNLDETFNKWLGLSTNPGKVVWQYGQKHISFIKGRVVDITQIIPKK